MGLCRVWRHCCCWLHGDVQRGEEGTGTAMSQKFDFLVVLTFGEQLTGRGAVGQGVEGRRVSIVLWCASRCE